MSKDNVTEELQEELRENDIPADAAEQEKKDGADAAVDEQSSEEKLLTEIESLKTENSELKDQYLRKSADFENYRKRMAKEKQDSARYANQELLKDLIEVIDNFERAIKSADESKDFDSFLEGIRMTEQHFTGMLSSKWGLLKIDSVNKEYDPAFHEALMMEETPDVEVPTVLEDFQTGYQLYDRVIRPSKVKVGKPAPEAAENKQETAEAAE